MADMLDLRGLPHLTSSIVKNLLTKIRHVCCILLLRLDIEVVAIGLVVCNGGVGVGWGALKE